MGRGGGAVSRGACQRDPVPRFGTPCSPLLSERRPNCSPACLSPSHLPAPASPGASASPTELPPHWPVTCKGTSLRRRPSPGLLRPGRSPRRPGFLCRGRLSHFRPQLTGRSRGGYPIARVVLVLHSIYHRRVYFSAALELESKLWEHTLLTQCLCADQCPASIWRCYLGQDLGSQR